MLHHYFPRRALFVAPLLCMLAVGLAFGVARSFHSYAVSSNFVTLSASHTQLQLNGQPYRFSGANIYWLGAGVSQSGVDYNTQVSSILKVVSQAPDNGMSETVVRAHTLGISAGCGNDTCIEPILGNIPQSSTAFSRIDYAISQAAQDHIRLIIPFVDNWNYGPGGIQTWISRRGSSNIQDFYTNATIINDFETYIGAILNHVNSITGIAYKNDPAILAWEEGNEINDAPACWISSIASYIKSQDPNHLVAFGTQSGLQRNNSLSVSGIDIEDAHYYPMDTSQLISDAKTAYQAGKVFYVGEYGWNQGDLNGYLSAIEANAAGQGYYISGDTYWSLFPKSVDHQDSSTWSYTLHYPGDTAVMSADIALLTNHAQIMSLTGTASGAPVGKTIWLKAQSSSLYVSAWLSDTNTPLEARSSQVSTWEEFDVVDAGNGEIGLIAHVNNDYVSAWTSDTNAPLEARSTHLQDWEMFRWVSIGSGTVALVAHGNGYYVSAWSSGTNTPLDARSTHQQAWETFQWGQVYLRSRPLHDPLSVNPLS